MSDRGIPFVADPNARQQIRTDSIIRGITALSRSRSAGEATEYARRTWPNDQAAMNIAQRAVVVPTSTSTANVPITNVISDIVSLLGPKSGAAAELFSRAMPLTFNSAGSIMVPSVTPSATGVSFILQGAPFPIKQLAFSAGPVLAPQKMALGFGITREQAEHTNAEAFIRAVLRENISLALDTLLLDTNASSTTRPAGMRYNVAGLTATAGGGSAALIGDLALLADAVSAVGGNDVVYLCNPKEWVKLKAYLPLLSVPVIATSGLATGVLMVAAPRALAVCGSDQPIRIENSIEVAVHYEDASPAELVTSGGTLAAPIRSAFQMDHTVVRLIADITWAMRTTGAVAWTSSVSW
jgi:hypothetical protein